MNDIQEFRFELNRFVNKYNKLDKTPFEIGEGEVLYPSEINMIEAIGKQSGNTVTQLCIVLGITKGAVSQMITKLAAKGYVERTRSEDSPKEVELTLTEKGRDVFVRHERFHQEMDQSMEQFIRSIPAEKIAAFREILGLADKHLDTYLDLGQKRM